MRKLAHFGRFAFADKSARVGSFQALANDPGDFRAGAFGQGFEFVERFFAADPCFGSEFDPDQDGAFVMLVGDVVGLCQILTSIADKVTTSSYQIFATSGTARSYLNSTAPGTKICSSSATNVSVGVTR
jgi:hypothetical protein